MSIRLDPRRVNALKHLAGEAGVRPGDLVRQWVEERLDASRGLDTPAATESVATRLDELAARITALEALGGSSAKAPPAPGEGPTKPDAPKRARRSSKAASAAPKGERVALHDEMIAVLRERGPMSAGDLASVVAERGRYAPPRSGKPIDAAMISQRVSNPTYRSRFVRNEGRIGLAD